MDWIDALRTFCEIVYRSDVENDWILVGSAGSVLQGADIVPNDIDIYTRSFAGVAELSALLADYHEPRDSGLPHHDPGWLSSAGKPYFTQQFQSGFAWTKGRWLLHRFPLEVVHIADAAGIPDSENGQGIWEGGEYIWGYRKHVRFEGFQVPVVPLEIQLESNLRRGRTDRVESIVHALRRSGCDRELLDKALSTKHREQVKELL